MSDLVRHGWCGDPARPVFTAFHLPADGRARAVVVICPPLGKEQGDTTRGQRLLAERLTARGIAAVRFDHLHTGESWGRQTDPEAGDHLLDGLRAAVALARDSGATQVAVVGLRLGALLTAALGDEELGGLAAVVLWDPVLRGSGWVRAEKTLYRLAFDDAPEVGDLVHLTGASWHHETVARVGRLTVDASLVARVGGPVAVATSDPESVGVGRLAAAGADVLVIPDQAGFVKPDSFVVGLPVETTAVLADWLDAHLPSESSLLTPTLASAARMSRPGDAVTVRTTVGTTAAGVVLWETSPVEVPVTRTLATQGTANDIRTGPARLWTEAALELAPHGVRTVRHDRLGVGESGPVDLADDYVPIHSQESVDDASSVLAELRGDSPASTTVYAGVCSGGWVAAGLAAAAPTTSQLVLVNQLMWRLETTAFDRDDLVRLGVPLPTDDGAAPTSRWARARVRAQPVVSAMLPYWAWKALGRLRIAQVPHLLLQDLASAHVATHLVFSTLDEELFLRQRGGQALDVLARRRGWQPRVTVSPHGDHAALAWQVRAAALEACRAALGLGLDAGATPHVAAPVGPSSSAAPSTTRQDIDRTGVEVGRPG